MLTTIVKWGNSQGIRLPKHLLDSMALSDNDMVEVVAENGQIIIKPVKQSGHRSIRERFEGFDGAYEAVKIDWGEPEGNEIW